MFRSFPRKRESRATSGGVRDPGCLRFAGMSEGISIPLDGFLSPHPRIKSGAGSEERSTDLGYTRNRHHSMRKSATADLRGGGRLIATHDNRKLHSLVRGAERRNLNPARWLSHPSSC